MGTLQDRLKELLNSDLTVTFGMRQDGYVEVIVGDEEDMFIVKGRTALTAIMEAQRVRNLHKSKLLQTFEGGVH